MATPILPFRALSELLNRAWLSRAAGQTFGGKRNVSEALGYKPSLTSNDYRARYKRGGIAGRIVDVYPKSTWRGGAELIEDENPKVETEFETAWNELAEKHSIWNVFTRADILAGQGRYAAILLGVPGELETEIEKLNGLDDLLYMHPYREDEMKIKEIESDPSNRRFGQVKTYRLLRKTDIASGSIDKTVHWSRVIHVADGVLDDPVYGEPRLERVWDYLDDLVKCVGGGSEAFWKRVDPGLFFNIDPTTVIEPGQIDAMKERAEEFVHGLERTMAMRGAKVTTIAADVSDFSPQAASILSLISGSTGIPQRLLLGSERGELASTQDKENWDVRVSDRRNEFGKGVVKETVSRFQTYGILPEATYEIRWPDLEDISDADRANIADKVAGLNKKAGGIVILPEEIRDIWLRLDPLTPAQIAANTPEAPEIVDPENEGNSLEDDEDNTLEE